MAGLAGFKPGEAGRATAHYCNTLHTHSLPPPPVFIWLPVSSQLGQLSSAGVAVRPLLQNITYYYPGKTTTLLSTHCSLLLWRSLVRMFNSVQQFNIVQCQCPVWGLMCYLLCYFILHTLPPGQSSVQSLVTCQLRPAESNNFTHNFTAFVLEWSDH